MKFVSLAIALAIVAASPAAAQCPSGPEGNLCKAENGDFMAMYMIGRDAFLEGRETGDLSEAYMWASRSKEGGFLGGRMLLKMIYLNMGDGGHSDFVQAHRWLSDGLASGDDYLAPWIKRLEAMMTPEQRAEASQAAPD